VQNCYNCCCDVLERGICCGSCSSYCKGFCDGLDAAGCNGLSIAPAKVPTMDWILENGMLDSVSVLVMLFGVVPVIDQ